MFEVLRDVEEDLLLLQSALCVLVSTLLDFECVQLLVLELQCQPDGREVSPTKFLQGDVLSINNFIDVHRVVAFNLVILEILVRRSRFVGLT